MRKGLFVLVIFLVGSVGGCLHLSHAQTPPLKNSKSLGKTETLSYDVDFAWGFIRGKVGEARLINKPTSNKQYFSQLVFQTQGIGEQFYPLRDTLETLYSPDKQIVRFEKRTSEKKYYLLSEASFSHKEKGVTVAKVKKWTPTEIREDTTLYIDNSEGVVVDMLSTLALIRSIDPETLRIGTRHKFIVPDGQNIVYADYELSAYESYKLKSGEVIQTLKVNININDKAFENTKNSVQVWLTRDENLTPILIKSKLKVGYAECRMTSYHSS